MDKLIEVWLCRNRDGRILIYYPPVLSESGVWQRPGCSNWPAAYFKQLYDYPLPRKGTMQLVDMEL